MRRGGTDDTDRRDDCGPPSALGLCLLAAIAPALAFMREGWTQTGATYTESGHVTSFSVPAPWIAPLFAWAAVGLAVALFLFTWLRHRSWAAGFGITLGALAVVLVALFAQATATWVSPPRIDEERTAPDGGRYAAWWVFGMGDQAEGLVRVSGVEPLQTSYEVLVAPVETDDGLSIATIRPSSSDGSSLVCGADGLVTAVVDGRCVWVYDANAGHVLTETDLEGSSPFRLIGDSNTGEDADVDSICRRVTAALGFKERPDEAALFTQALREIPRDANLLAALDSPNAWIRAASRRIVEAGGAGLYPEATKRLASAPK